MKIVINKNGTSGNVRKIKCLEIQDGKKRYMIHSALSTRAAHAIEKNLGIFLKEKFGNTTEK